MTECDGVWRSETEWDGVRRSVTQCDAVWRSETEWDGVRRSVTQCDAVWHSVTLWCLCCFCVFFGFCCFRLCWANAGIPAELAAAKPWQIWAAQQLGAISMVKRLMYVEVVRFSMSLLHSFLSAPTVFLYVWSVWRHTERWIQAKASDFLLKLAQCECFVLKLLERGLGTWESLENVLQLHYNTTTDTCEGQERRFFNPTVFPWSCVLCQMDRRLFRVQVSLEAMVSGERAFPDISKWGSTRALEKRWMVS